MKFLKLWYIPAAAVLVCLALAFVVAVAELPLMAAAFVALALVNVWLAVRLRRRSQRRNGSD